MAYSYRARSGAGRFSNRSSTNFRKKTTQRNNNQSIDPRKFVRVATIQEQDAYVPTHMFADFELHSTLQKNLAAKGYVTPSPIQDQSIPVALQGRDVIGMASTGTGKTAAFALPVLHKLITDKNASAVIIAPTRELAQQIEQECRELGKGSGLLGALLIGGSSMGKQLQELRYNPRIVIGTPGRMKDHMQRGTLRLQKFNMIVLDEVDRMLDMGFVNDVTYILGNASATRQSFFFSATMDPRVRKLIDGFTKDPFIVSIKPSTSSDSVHQDVVHYHSKEDKLEKLHDLLNKQEVSKVIVFDETQRSVERLYQLLSDRGFSTAAIHGGKSQGQRQRALAEFKQSKVHILVATDVAARGIDVTGITHVVNFTAPKAYEDYIHRIGRAGRAGEVGYALTFVPQGIGARF